MASVSVSALIVVCCTVLFSYLLFKSKCYAEGDETKFKEIKPEINGTKLANHTKQEKEESHPDQTVAEEDQLENGVVLPTIAPATPQSERHTFPHNEASISSLDNEKDPLITHNNSEEGTSKEKHLRQSVDQVDEVKFDDLVLNPVSNSLDEPQKTSTLKDENEHANGKEKTKIDNNQETLKENDNDVKLESLDLMKLAVGESGENVDVKKEDVGGFEKDAKKSQETEATSKEVLVDENDIANKDVGILESFKDWKEKQATNGKRIEQEKLISQSIQRKRYNKKTNYASNECGAKVVAANTEAENTAAILTENKDLYMLNPCSSSIWFVIELCEKVQVETVEIANFELFSSTPEAFKVYFSSRYPTREWQLVGSFVAKSERVIQSFNLQEKSYAKFVKIEMTSHFGKEHYCPLSLVRIFGRSEVEELEDSEDTTSDHDHTRDETAELESKKDNADGESKNDPSNFLKSATDVVIGLVNKATETFTGKSDKRNGTRLEKGEGESDIIQRPEEGSVETNRDDRDINSKEQDVILDDGARNRETVDNKTDVKVAVNASSDLVVLLEGDDGDDDSTDANQTDRKCVFNAEIQGNKCANPLSYFWIPYVFKYRICPLNYDENQSNTRIRIAVVNKTMDASPHVALSSSNNEGSELYPDTTNAGSSNKSNAFVSSTNFVLKSETTKIKDKVTADAHVPVIPSVSEETRGGSGPSESVGNISMTPASESNGSSSKVNKTNSKTELLRRDITDSKSSCDQKTMISPDLSQLIESAILSNHQIQEITSRTSASVEATEVPSESDKHVKNETKKDEVKLMEDQDDHVDVLVINIDEKLGEGRAEATQKPPLNSSESDSAESKKSDSTAVAEEHPVRDSMSVSDSLPVKDSFSDSVSSSVNDSSPVIDSLPVKDSSPVSDSLPVKDSLPASDSSPVKDSLPITDSIPNSTTVIIPSFSQPTTSSLGSLKTSESPNIVQVSYEVSENQTLSKHSDVSIKPATISELPSTQSTTITATRLVIKPTNDVQPSEGNNGESMQKNEKVEGTETNRKIDSVDSTMTVSNIGSSEKLSTVDASVKTGTAEDDQKIGTLDSRVKDGTLGTKEKPGTSGSSVKTETPDSVVKIGSGSSGNNKESAILKLKNRVKALETNLSLSTLYLEEMSKRYRTALEDQQKQFKAKLNALNLSVFENKQVIKKQQKTIEELTKQLLQLSIQFKNFTEFTEEQQKKMAERYLFSCTIEALIIIILLWNCMTRSKSVEHRETRRHSAPSLSANQMDRRPFLAITSGDVPTDKRDKSPPAYQFDSTFPAAALPVTKRKRQRKKKSQSDDNIFIIENATTSRDNTNREMTIMNNTAGVLFSAGRGIINSLTGAFSKQKKQIGSRRTRALVDSNVYEHAKPFTRSKSLGTIEEHEDLYIPQRHKSVESISASKTSYKGLEHDKRRG